MSWDELLDHGDELLASILPSRWRPPLYTLVTIRVAHCFVPRDCSKHRCGPRTICRIYGKQDGLSLERYRYSSPLFLSHLHLCKGFIVKRNKCCAAFSVSSEPASEAIDWARQGEVYQHESALETHQCASSFSTAM